VLIRALAPLQGIDEMREARNGVSDRQLCSGPAKLCQALGIDGTFNGADLVAGDHGVTIVDDGAAPPRRPANSVRIGLTAGAEHPWRWYVAGDPNLSRPG
jgi:DNA-3-methyladenine glycosylase